MPLPKNLPGANSVFTIAAAKSGNTGSPAGVSRKRMSGMNTGTRYANARRKSTFICSMSESGFHSGSDDSTSVAPSLPPSTVLISFATAVVMGSAAFVPGLSMDSRTTPMRRPLSEPGAPEDFVCTA